MQEQQSLTLHWCSFVKDSSNVVTSVFGCKGGQYFDHVSQRPSLLLNIRLTRPKIIDASLMLISRSGQQWSHLPYYLYKRPIQWLWMDVTMLPFDCWKCRTKNHWRSDDAHLNDILTVIGCYTIVSKKAWSRYWQPMICFYEETIASECFETTQFLIHH